MADTIFQKTGSTLAVKPFGRLDAAAAPVLEREIMSRLDGVRNMTMDFSEVEYISSGGLRVLLAAEQLLEDRGGRLHLTHVNRHIVDIFEMVGFLDVVKVERD